jgi:hypothetical protein
MTYTEAVTTAANLTVGQLLRAFTSHDGEGHTFLNGSELPGGSASSANLPSIRFVTLIQQPDYGSFADGTLGAGTVRTGMVKIGISDPANAASWGQGSVMAGQLTGASAFTLEADAEVITATG